MLVSRKTFTYSGKFLCLYKKVCCRITMWGWGHTVFASISIKQNFIQVLWSKQKIKKKPHMAWYISFQLSYWCAVLWHHQQSLLKVLHRPLTSVLRPSREVRMPRMELRPTSLASSGSWDEYCSTSFRTFAASWMVWTGAWDYRMKPKYTQERGWEGHIRKDGVGLCSF